MSTLGNLKKESSIVKVSGKGAVVTGAGSGIGAGIAAALVEAGASVVIADIEPDKACWRFCAVTMISGTASLDGWASTAFATPPVPDAACANSGPVQSTDAPIANG